jgi:hypothetical protein
MHRNIADWDNAEGHAIAYPYAQVERFSPSTKAIVEIGNSRDLAVLTRIYADSVLLGDDSIDGWDIKYAQGDFNMTSDSALFPPREQWESQGYSQDMFGRWTNQSGDLALPLYQGGMIWQYDPAYSEHLRGANQQVQWANREYYIDRLPSPQYVISQHTAYSEAPTSRNARIGFRGIQNATNQRTLIATLIPRSPCGHSIGILHTRDLISCLKLLPCLCSFPIDYVLRPKMSQANISLFYINELPAYIPNSNAMISSSLINITARLAMVMSIFAPEWLYIRTILPHLTDMPLKRLWAVTEHERLRLRCMLDAIVAELYGLTWDDQAWILRDCDHPVDDIRNKAFARALNPKGFWRVDKEQAPELRHTVLTLLAFRDLKDTIAAHGSDRDQGIAAFCTDNDGDGWMLPETFRLADLGLGHDARAQEPQPVASVLGPRFLDWQLAQSPEESWAECERHARNLLGEAGFRQLQAELCGEADQQPSPSAPPPATGQTNLFGEPELTDLFGQPTTNPRRK